MLRTPKSWLLLVVVMIPVMLVISFNINNSTAVDAAMSRLRASAAARKALGTPIERGAALGGDLAKGCSGKSEVVETRFTVSGPRGEGTLHVDAQTWDGETKFTEMELDMGDGRVIDLRTRPAAKPTEKEVYRSDDGSIRIYEK